MSVVLKYSQKNWVDPLLFSKSLWRSLTCMLVLTWLMFKYMYMGPTALRDLLTTEQLRVKCLAQELKKRHTNFGGSNPRRGVAYGCLVNSAQNQVGPMTTRSKTNSAHILNQPGPHIIPTRPKTKSAHFSSFFFFLFFWRYSTHGLLASAFNVCYLLKITHM